ncbi:MAG: phospho-sugar mutase [Oscillospiraceae bacterium]|jgi:phosphoglucomutase|nr:phospho-sugar mutase [Oscillospiraceae bacterium]
MKAILYGLIMTANYESIKAEYSRWISSGVFCDELHKIADSEPEITDRFRKHLSFGTGGLRGIIGAGINRMNGLVVRRATQGLADYIKDNGGMSACIAYDTRNMSRDFAAAAAEVLCANGVKVFMFTDVRPTPMLSFAVREKQAFTGIVITASHNPREYNGYKVYGADGGQITDEAASAVSARMNSYDVLSEIPRISLEDARESGLLCDLDEADSLYYEKVKSLIVRGVLVADHAPKLSILFTPLHGSGNIPVRRVLGESGFANLSVVAEQELPDGNFPTVPYPNPEEAETFTLALQKAQGKDFDIILATDPDCDRIGVQARTRSGEYAPLSGNQIGALLCDYLITAKKETGTLEKNAAVIKTIVTTELARKICMKNNIALVETLTGFKYIGEKIGGWEQDNEYSFLFGFEESYGYLADGFVRDKDAVIAAALICEMALYHKVNKHTLHDALDALYLKYGYTDEKLISVTLEGADGMKKINSIMKMFRSDAKALMPGEEVIAAEDYLTGLYGLPKADVVKILFADESWLAVRPSGTEPKIKFYLGAAGKNKEEVAARCGVLQERLTFILN